MERADMTITETITVRLGREDKAMLAQLAGETKRSKSFLAAEAIRAYVARETEIVAHLQEGLEDVRGGRLVSNKVAQGRWQKAINKAVRAKR
jgi:predicted transcriptional regulator